MNSIPSSVDDIDHQVDIDGLDLHLDPSLVAFLQNYDALQEATAMQTWPADHSCTNSASILTKFDNKQPKNLPPSLKKKSWKQRQKEEIQRLREEVITLSATLQQQQTSIACVARPLGSPHFERKTVNYDAIRSVEKAVATLEQERLQISIKENTRLRKSVGRFKLQAERIRIAFMKHFSLGKERSHKGTINLPIDSRGIFDKLELELDEIYSDLESFCERTKAPNTHPLDRRDDSAKDPQRIIFVEIVDDYVVPFDIRNTEKVVWALKTGNYSAPSAMTYERYGAGESSVTKRLNTSIARHGVEMSVQIHISIRRYVEQDRTVFVSRMLVEPVHGALIIAFQVTTCLVLRQGVDSACGPTTVMQTHCQISELDKPACCGNLPDPNLIPAPCYQRWARAWQKAISDFNHKTEDMLILESL